MAPVPFGITLLIKRSHIIYLKYNPAYLQRYLIYKTYELVVASQKCLHTELLKLYACKRPTTKLISNGFPTLKYKQSVNYFVYSH